MTIKFAATGDDTTRVPDPDLEDELAPGTPTAAAAEDNNLAFRRVEDNNAYRYNGKPAVVFELTHIDGSPPPGFRCPPRFIQWRNPPLQAFVLSHPIHSDHAVRALQLIFQRCWINRLLMRWLSAGEEVKQ